MGLKGRVLVAVAGGRGDHVGVCVARSVWVTVGESELTVGEGED